MNICYFGNYNPEYSRNRILIKGLSINGANILPCHSTLSGWRLFRNLRNQHIKIKNQYDLMLVGFSETTRSMVPLAKLLTRKKIVWDAFYSLYDTWVYDKKLVSKYNPKAWCYWFCDLLNCALADKILLDTDEHIRYFVKTFKIKKEKFIRVLVGSDDSVMHPRERKNTKVFTVHFHGNYIPLQGAKYIIKAAKILEKEDILFRITGSRGQEYKQSLKLVDDLKLSNIKFISSVCYEGLAGLIADCDICLGIFGDTEKTQRVIPNKVYESIAMAKGIITADTPAIRELFTDQENILLCRAADQESLAEKILELKNNENLKDKIANGGYEIFKKYCTPKIIGKKLLEEIKNV